MKRLIASLLLAALFLTALPTRGLAFGAEKHDSYMTKVLFGQDNPYYNNSEEIQMLEAASYLCLDFTNESKGTTDLNLLRTNGVKSIPKKVVSFSFKGNQYHRQYTHLGWTYPYEDDKAKWEVRKDILLATVNKVFDFGAFTDALGTVDSYTEKCQAFSALIYYVHVLGDYCADENGHASETPQIMQTMMPLAASGEDADIISDLKTYLAQLFVDQADSRVYTSMMTDLQLLQDNITEQDYDYKHITETDKTELESWANQLMGLLEEYVPMLLQKETFFTKVFA